MKRRLTNPRGLLFLTTVIGVCLCMTVFFHVSSYFKTPVDPHLLDTPNLRPRNILTAANDLRNEESDNGYLDYEPSQTEKPRHKGKKKKKKKVNLQIIEEKTNAVNEEDVIMGDPEKHRDAEDGDYDTLGRMIKRDHKDRLLDQEEKRQQLEENKKRKVNQADEATKEEQKEEYNEDLDWLKMEAKEKTVLKKSKTSGVASNRTLVFIEGSQEIRHCITGDVIGAVEEGLTLAPLPHLQDLSKEDTRLREKSFQKVFDTRAWGHSWDPAYKDLNASGMGSTVYWTQELSATLHIVINQMKSVLQRDRIRLLDVPCGDMQWMSRFLISRDDIDYTGMDIVPDLISHHRKTFKDQSWRFRTADVLEVGVQEQYDVVLSRMMMQHLYHNDVIKLLKLVSQSGSQYLLATTFAREQVNKELDISENPGRFRPLNLEAPPISLPPPLCLSRDGPGDKVIEGWNHFVGLWKLPLQSVKNCKNVHPLKLKGSSHVIFSCAKRT